MIDELKSEVAHDPHERGEVLRVLLGVRVVVTASGFNLDVLREVDDEAEIVELGLIDRLLAVIDEVGCEQDGQRENSHIVVLLLICGAEPLCIEHEHLNGVTIGCEAINRLTPDPHSLLKQKRRLVRHHIILHYFLLVAD